MQRVEINIRTLRVRHVGPDGWGLLPRLSGLSGVPPRLSLLQYGGRIRRWLWELSWIHFAKSVWVNWIRTRYEDTQKHETHCGQ